MTKYAKIIGTGSYLPPRRVTNHDLATQLAEKGIETSDDWIVSRSGISARHWAEPDVTSSDLAVKAAEQAIEAAGIDRQSIDLIIVATSTPDFVFPSTACIVQEKLGITNHCPAFDLQAVCSGFVYALATADKFIRSGSHRNVLVIGTEVFSRILDFNDRTTCVLFGDGAGAVLLSASEEPGILSTAMHSDGRHVDILCVPGNVAGGNITGNPFLHMDGQAVFKLAVNVLDKVAREAMEAASVTPGQIDWLIPHQANIRIMQGTAKKLGLPAERMVATVHEHGNTSAASIPLALDVAVRDGRIRAGQTVLMEGVGGGFTWGAVLLRM
ncbi:Beta-ketoacyl-[acyl-carrier-protein] synthase III [Cupriavidus necator]|uniref:Beta-ketoacyl-[acyl-carrier-protein] synthase III n=2 Tax=Cupriavidus necator (strain ATCC 17699 / DSM 428 / KCTC 22496 / NCIMB 10442 / H16 / Stanier 337) TaxID=381666 RepID=FABH_CUPNH|nr:MULTISPECIES: beta-ketoacyl-ACP synthase III [Cupriavidus]Q0K8L9.1 RecName: Full=Beta-ketoacyl-[acyl-carrier-protein] synthase III; Short=Beta-ketoacyl-ACP synthase III; Short=KAS III; AltName: Full=3-oxoacyl-[acyl-carrier-protein] synthase 3; AltName: Full=3-oxoacyl-[acyl-carrier-protein] synthase III [Cupriavidus necator H16]EON16172.1 3-oxoacyl-(acyl carrier protein) synthase III [Cupriavidus sp. GA3-3]KUE85777.1 3-oxoacyl-ACP synthase [Cupriavidus necator]QCC01436.1 ketoacyl-ACP synthase